MFKNFIINEKILFLSVLKWLALSLATGGLVGIVVGLFLLTLYRCIDWTDSLPAWRIALIPLGLFISHLCIVAVPEAAGHGTDKVLTALRRNWGKVPTDVVPAKIVSTIATLACGGVVGTEGPSVQIGAGLMSWFCEKIRCGKQEQKKLVICGVSAALSCVFGAPVAGAVFGIEVLYVGEMFYKTLLPAVISAITSYFVCLHLGVPYDFPVIAIPPLSFIVLLQVFVCAIFLSCVCIFHVECFNFIEKIYKKIPFPFFFKIIFSSLILIGTVFFFGWDFLGLGMQEFNRLCLGDKTVWYAFILKSFLLAVTLSGGGSGGVLTPTFFVGASAGALFGQIFHLDTGFFAVLGFVGLIAGCVNTPVSGIFLAMEMFGASLAPYAGFVCVLCYMLSANRSLYPSQIFQTPKSDVFILDPKKNDPWNVRAKKRKTAFKLKKNRRKKLLQSNKKTV